MQFVRTPLVRSIVNANKDMKEMVPTAPVCCCLVLISVDEEKFVWSNFLGIPYTNWDKCRLWIRKQLREVASAACIHLLKDKNTGEK
jgi:hypothetical protein